jgi:fumarylacetoacetate (FAA) hydrolase family protein
MLERVIEESAGGDPTKAAKVRRFIADRVGREISKIKPGSIEAEALKRVLIDEGIWSQYLEVGIGPYAEIFTKAPIMSAVGYGAEIGVHPESNWNNPEPEVVLVVNSRSDVLGATLGNDLNLRDFEGRSALLLGKAKDNNASCAIGPLIRLFDETFGIEQVRQIEVRLEIEGEDGFHLAGTSSMKKISRDVLELVEHAAGSNHQYPDGFVLFTGTLFSPTQDRAEQGRGFTHKIGDKVTISSAELGALVNRVNTSDKAAPWTFGVGALIENLRSRSLL